ncbi:MAG: response regulator [Blautia sp.]|nr:response regulator [Lachnoclostridium sp.]MCM1212468.1 response regulator [Blautia sp.]
MYHCHIQFYLVGTHNDVFEFIKESTPLEHFTYSFLESGEPEKEAVAGADVLCVNLQGKDREKILQRLKAIKKKEAELVLLVDGKQDIFLSEDMTEIEDLWTLPMSREEFHFRFGKWQRNYKQKVDFWQSKQFLDICINSSPNLIWFKDKEGVHEIVNESFCKVVNKTKEQVKGRRHAYIWDVEQDDPACIESEQEVMRRKKTCVGEETISTGEGKRTLTTYKSPLYDWDGSVMGTVGVAVDVTKEQAYEREIIEKNQTLEMLFSTMDCGVMCHSIDGSQIISINQAALRLLDYASQEELEADGFHLIARTVMDEDKGKLRECINSLTKAGDSVNVEYRVQHKNGKILHVLGNIKIIEEGGELYYQRFLLDFTAYKLKDEQKWAKKNQEFQYQEQMFGLFATFLSDNIDDIYMMLDEDGKKAEFVSANIERVLGVSWQIVMEDVGRLGRAGYLMGKEISREDLAALEPGMSLEQMETERIHQTSGERKWFRESVHCVLVQGMKKIVVYISDRTKEKQIQNTLSEALNIAQTANKAKSAFLGSVSHDIRTPMNAIIGFIPLLQEEADNPEHVREYTQKISAASQHLLGLINDVLDMNKIESGSAVLNISELNLAQMIEEINTIIRPQANAKRQKFEIFTISLKNEHLLGDKLRINQILINILSNAVKYTPEGGNIKMTVDELHQVDESYSRIRFTISDDGQGMSEEYQKVIFEPFSREQTAAWNKTQGTGLGMSITKSLVDLMHGSIKVKSKIGEGTTFIVELELRNQNVKDDPGFWSKHHVARMIVADDDEDICRDIVKKMAKTGVEVSYTTNGTTAIEMIRSAREDGRPYDLIMLDWKMPDVDGLATARMIRKNYSKKIPILLFTAYDWREIEQEALEIGVEHFLQKPFFMSSFKDAIQRMMGTGAKKIISDDDKTMLAGRRVLVAEDIDINQMVLTKLLGALGAECDIAENGQEAVEKYINAPAGGYDIILMDIQMPVMNGYDAAKAIRASAAPGAWTIPIIAMSANAFVDDVRNALNAGMNAHISKPIIFEKFKSTLREVLDKKENKGM